MTAISIASATVINQPLRRGTRSCSRLIIHASVAQYRATDTVNFSGLSHSGAPTSTRGSTTASTARTGRSAVITSARPYSPRWPRRTSARRVVMTGP